MAFLPALRRPAAPAAPPAGRPSSPPSPPGHPDSGAARNSKSPGPPAGAAPRPPRAAPRSARPAPPPPPPVPHSGQPDPHTRAAPDAASPNPTMITNRTPAPTRRRSIGGLTGYKFADAMFNGDTPVLGPIVVVKLLDLDRAQFASQVRIEANAGTLSCRRARFPGGVRLDVGRADVWLDDLDLSAPSLLTGVSHRRAEGVFAPGSFAYLADSLGAAMHNLDKSLVEGSTVSGPAGITEQPKLLSLQRANVAGFTLGNVDLADCRFAGVHNLDKLRLEADTIFGLSPAVAGWERRQVIAEESAWRAARARPGRWRTPRSFSPEEQLQVLSPGAITVLYRALRKSREDAKDEPGAADFYYGEMEMRRHDRGKSHANQGWSRGLVSRGVLTAYWLVSGYGLRAWRALAALAVVVGGLAAASTVGAHATGHLLEESAVRPPTDHRPHRPQAASPPGAACPGILR